MVHPSFESQKTKLLFSHSWEIRAYPLVYQTINVVLSYKVSQSKFMIDLNEERSRSISMISGFVLVDDNSHWQTIRQSGYWIINPMSDLNTKQRIINASIRLFNEKGLANVRLQQIADEIGISVGNLAYHYRNQEAINEAINEDLDEANEILSCYRLYPNLIDFDFQLSKYFSFIRKYPFYFLDILEFERHYPEIRTKRQVHISIMINQIRKRFDYIILNVE